MAKKKQPAEDLLKSKVKRALTLKISDKELREKAAEMRSLDEEIKELEAKFAEVKSEWKDKISLKQKQHDSLYETVVTGEEKRTVDCIEERDYAANAVRYYYEGELKEERVMSAEERQTDLALQQRDDTKDRVATKKRRFPGNGKNPADFKKAAAGDAEPEQDDLTHVIRSETNGKTKRSAVDGPVTGSA